MVAVRKLFPVLAIAALLLGATIPASAQIGVGNPLACVANAGVPPLVRAEGFTELVGDVVISCTGGNPAAPFLANFQVFLNTNITSRLTGGYSEALLMLDEPTINRLAVGGGAGTATPLCVSPDVVSNSSNDLAIPGGVVAGGGVGCNPTAGGAGQTFQGGTYTVFRGQKPVQGENSIVWAGVPILPPGTTGTRVIRLVNVRANAAAIGSSNTLIPNQITMFISISASQSLALNNPQQTVAYVQPGIQFDVRSCAGGAASATSFVQCVSQNGSLFTSGAGAGAGSFGLRFREGFQTAFKPRIDPGQTTSQPGQVFNSESGFVRTDNSTLGLGGFADHGTRLAARFNNVPAGVRLFVSTGATGAVAGASSPGLLASLIATDAVGSGPSTGVVGASATLSCAGLGTTVNGVTDTGIYPAAEVSVTNGSGVAVWEISGSNPSLLDTAHFLVGVAYTANTGSNLPGLGQSSVTGNFAPFYAASNTAAGISSASLPIPRFLDNPIASDTFLINQCVSNLLFPFVTNQAGFDTGIAISNTSQDPFTGNTSRQQAGTCTMNYYGGTTGGGAAPAAQTTNAVVAAGQQLTFVLSSGGGLGVTGTPGFQGYIIATCRFQYAHGFAFITDGPIGQARVAEGYLALVMDSGIGTRTGSQSEVLSH